MKDDGQEEYLLAIVVPVTPPPLVVASVTVTLGCGPYVYVVSGKVTVVGIGRGI